MADSQLVRASSGLQSESSGIAYYWDRIQRPPVTWDKEELLDVVYWWRQVLGLIMGLIWAALPVTGMLGLFAFFGVNIVVTMLFYKNVLGVDEDDYGGHGEFMQEGLQGSLGIFMVTWTLGYTALHAQPLGFT